MTMATSVVVLPERPLPFLIWLLGGRFRDSKRSYRMAWGELSLRWTLALELCLFEEGFSIHVAACGLSVYVKLPFLRRFARNPHEMMESWGFSTFENGLHLHWGRRTRIVACPFTEWRHVSHEVRRPDGSWVPFVGSYEVRSPGQAETQFNGKPWLEPDGRETETYPYHYLLDSGEVQHVTATVHVERWMWRLRSLPLIKKVRHSINVEFSDEVGERAGSWKGGTLGCGYDLRENETPRECLRRMQRERRFR